MQRLQDNPFCLFFAKQRLEEISKKNKKRECSIKPLDPQVCRTGMYFFIPVIKIFSVQSSSDYVSELGDAPGEGDREDWSVSSSSLANPLRGSDEKGRAVLPAPSRSRFFCFIRLFWNQIFTWVSLSSSVAAISTRRARVRYLLKWNSFSNSVSCRVLKLVRMALLWTPARPKSDALTENKKTIYHTFI